MGHFAENLKSLARRDPALAKRLALPVSGEQVRIAADGRMERRHLRHWSPLAVDPATLQETLARPAEPGERPVLFGIGDGAPVMALLATAPPRGVIAWDRDPWLIRQFLERHRLGPQLASGQLRLALNADLIGLLEVEGASFRPHPVARLHYTPEWRLVEERGVGDKPFAMLLTGELFVDDLDEALRAEGYRVYPLDATLHAVEELLHQARQLKPAIVVTVNYRNGLAEFCEEIGTPLLSWEIDPTTDRLKPLRRPAPQARLFTYRATQVEEFRAAGFAHVDYLPLATNPERRSPPPAESAAADDAAPPKSAIHGTGGRGGTSVLGGDRMSHIAEGTACPPDAAPIAFVGASMRRQAEEHRRALLALLGEVAGAPPIAELATSLDALLAVQAADFSRYRVPELFLEHFGGLIGKTRPGLDPIQLAGEIAAAEKRLAWLAALAPRGLHVWGDAGFEPLVAAGARYRGPADHFHDLNRIYGRAAINIDIGRIYQSEIVTMRVFDVLACGGFMIAEWSDALPELFEIDRELVVYRTLDELLAKVDHYLARPEEAHAIADRGRERVLRDHTIRRRLRRMLGTLAP